MADSTERVSLIIGTAGHIDHGKTSLIRALTSIDTDRLAEEKRRGLTIELGFAYLDFEDNGRSYRAAIVDVPGHERFIRNMLAGVTGMDLVLFTIAADDGIMPQTREHLDIIRLLGIKDVFFVITKADLVDDETMEILEAEIKDLIAATPLSSAPLFRVSVKTGQGLGALAEVLKKRVLALNGRDPGWAYFRLPVDRSFTIKGFGTVITGTVAGGTLTRYDDVLVFPMGRTARVRGIESMHLPARSVSRGERAALNLAGVSWKELGRGTCLMEPGLGPFLQILPVVDCLFEFLDRDDSSKKKAPGVRNNSLIKVHHQAGEALARIRFAGGKRAVPGTRAPGRLFLKRPLLMLHGDAFILRDPAVNTTVGGGRVRLSYPSRTLVPPFRRMAGCTDKETPGESGDTEASGALCALLGPTRPGLDTKTLSLLFNVRADHLDDFFRKEGLLQGEGFYFQDEVLLSKQDAKDSEDGLKAIMRDFHREHPQDQGLAPDDLISMYLASQNAGPAMTATATPALRVVLRGLTRRGELSSHGHLVSLPGHEPGLRGPERAIEEKILALLKRRGLALTKRGDMPFQGIVTRDLERVLSHLKKSGRIVTLGRDAFISAEVVEEAWKKCARCIMDEGRITAARFRDILGTGRKIAILLLEYFDAEGLTLRRGDERTLR